MTLTWGEKSSLNRTPTAILCCFLIRSFSETPYQQLGHIFTNSKTPWSICPRERDRKKTVLTFLGKSEQKVRHFACAKLSSTLFKFCINDQQFLVYFVYIGATLGTIVSMFCSGYLAFHYGWPSIFYVFGTYNVTYRGLQPLWGCLETIFLMLLLCANIITNISWIILVL